MKVEVRGPIGRLEFSLLCARVWQETRDSVCRVLASPKTLRRIATEFLAYHQPFIIYTGDEVVSYRDLNTASLQHVFNPITGSLVYLEEAAFLPDSVIVAASSGLSSGGRDQAQLHSLVAIPPGAS